MLRYTVCIIFLCLGISLALMIACGVDYTSSQRYSGDLYFISGLLREGEPISLDSPIRIGKVAEVGDTVDLRTMMISARVTLIDSLNHYQIELIPAPNQFVKYLCYYDSSQSFIPKEKQTYYIRIEIEGYAKIITAQTTIPAKFLIEPNPGFTSDSTATMPEMKAELIGSTYPMKMKAEVMPGERYMVLYYRAFCLENWQDAEYSDNYFFKFRDKPEEEEEYEDPATGYPRKMDFFTTSVPNDKGFINDKTYGTLFAFYGRYELTIYSVDNNYYYYLYKPEGFNKSGVTNGIGYLGSVSGTKLYTRIIQ